MKLELKSKDVPMTRTLVEQAERRLRYALEGFGDRVQRVRLHLAGDPEAHEEPGYRCRVQALTDEGSVVLIEERRSHPVTAVILASDRIARRIAKRLRTLPVRRRRAHPA